jgi:DNA primase
MIDQATVDQIFQSAKIVDVVSDFVTLRKRGVNYIGCCPFHNEKTPSFTVSPAKDIFKCFGCGKGGNAVNFIMEHESVSYVDALRYLAKKYNIEIQEKELTPEEAAQHTARESMFVINSYAQKYFSDILHKHAEGIAVGLSYFKERGFREDIIDKFQLGYALEERDAFTKEALKNGYKKEYLIKTGLTIEGENNYVADRFRGRVLFPVHSLSGKVVAFGGRILKTDTKTAKYLNSPESEIYHKSNELYGIFFAKQSIQRADCCYLVEGYTDVISMHQSGIENVVASSGTSLTVGQIRLISRFTNNITVIYDGDAAGIKASIRGIDLLLEEGMNVKVLLLPDGEDPDSFAQKQDSSAFINYINEHQTDFIGFKTQLLLEDAGKDPVKKALLISDIVKSIALIPDNIIRSVYVKECSKTLDIDESILYTEIGKINKTKRQKDFSQRKQAVEQIYEAERRAAAEQHNAIPANQQTNSKNNDREKAAFDILRYLVRYGDKILYQHKSEETEEFKNISVAEYILSELENDGLIFDNPKYQQMIDEARQFKEQEWCSEKYFVNHTDSEISRIVVDLITEPYQLSKIHEKMGQRETEEERLLHLVPRSIFEYKNKVLMFEIQKIQEQIKAIQNSDNEEELNRLLKEYSTLNIIKNQLAKELGERIVLK